MTAKNDSEGPKDLFPVCLDEDVRLSQSRLWDWQARLRSQLWAGVGTEAGQAWPESERFYLKNHPGIAHTYAQIIVAYIQDLLRDRMRDIATESGKSDIEVCIVELEAGAGKFSYYCQKYIAKLCNSLKLPVKLTYLMTDSSPEAIAFWQSQPSLKDAIAQGGLDLACFDPADPKPLQLVHGQRTLSATTPAQVMIVLASQGFGSSPADVFQVKGGRLREARVQLSAPAEQVVDGVPQSLSALTYALAPRYVEPESYYPQPLWNQRLSDYCAESDLEGYFTFPTTALNVIQFFTELSPNRILLINSDSGYASSAEIQNREPPRLYLHGSQATFDVNFDALRRYTQQRGGVSWMLPASPMLRTGVQILGPAEPRQPGLGWPHTATAIELLGFSRIEDGYQLASHLLQARPFSLRAAISHLRANRWDPALISRMLTPLLQSLKDSEDAELGGELHTGLLAAEDLIYPLPHSRDLYCDLAMLHDALADNRSAIRLLQKSIAYYQGSFAAYFNLGMSYYLDTQIRAALDSFRKAKAYQPSHPATDRWIKNLQQLLAFARPAAAP